VGWGTVRQTPTLMHLAESAAWAIVLASRAGVPPAALATETLQRHLVAHGVMLSFFNDLDMANRAPCLAAMQYLGTKGFFPGYDAAPDAPLTPAGHTRWEELSRALLPPGTPPPDFPASATRATASLLVWAALNRSDCNDGGGA
jgi:hypothetical protein